MLERSESLIETFPFFNTLEMTFFMKVELFMWVLTIWVLRSLMWLAIFPLAGCLIM